MHRYKNIAITGRKQAGKSTLARWLVEQLGKPVSGFRTVRYALTDKGPLYQLADLVTGEAEPISRLLPEGIRGIPESFDGFGAGVLEACLQDDAPVVLLDEIGRFEKTSGRFLCGLDLILDSGKTVIAVLKQEDLPHIQAIKDRRDTLLVDLDLCSREQAREILQDWQKNR